MIHKDLGDIRALTLIRVVLERTENEELRNQLEEYLQNNEELWDDAHIADFYTFATFQTIQKYHCQVLLRFFHISFLINIRYHPQSKIP